MAFKQHIDCFGVPVLIVGKHNAEHWRRSPAYFVRVDNAVGRYPFWIKAHQTSVRTDPKLARAGFEKVGDIAMRQALIGRVVGKSVAVET